MKGYPLSDVAKADIRDLWAWVAADHSPAANKLTRDILECCARAARHPLTGSRKTNFTGKAVRFLLVHRILYIAYDPAARPLEILRVLHTSRDIKSVLAEDS